MNTDDIISLLVKITDKMRDMPPYATLRCCYGVLQRYALLRHVILRVVLIA